MHISALTRVVGPDGLRTDVVTPSAALASLFGTFVLLWIISWAGRKIFKWDQKVDDWFYLAVAFIGVGGFLAQSPLLRQVGDAFRDGIQWVAARVSSEAGAAQWSDELYLLVVVLVIFFALMAVKRRRSGETEGGRTVVGPFLLAAALAVPIFASGAGANLMEAYINNVGVNAWNWTLTGIGWVMSL